MTDRIQSVEAIPLDIGFKETFRFGTVDRKQSQNVVVRLTTDDGHIGYGEACPVPAFTAETQASIVDQIDGMLREMLVGADPLAWRPLLRGASRRLAHQPFALAAIDIALHDLAGRILGVPISTLLGGRWRDRIEVHGSVGWDDPKVMARTAVTQRELGYAVLKLYAGRDTVAADLGRIEAVRRAVGPEASFIVDVNGLWSISQCLSALPALADLGVVLLEQPLPRWDERGQAEAVRASRIDIAADESVFLPPDVARIGSLRTARVINLGLSKLGGVARAAECEAVARAHGLGVTVGSVLELGIATTAGLHFAASLAELTYPSYLMGPLKYERQISSPPLQVEHGEIAVPYGPGLGIEVDEELLRSLDLRR
jgi:muconate cycloisomerase